jgi:hypothetical protein
MAMGGEVPRNQQMSTKGPAARASAATHEAAMQEGGTMSLQRDPPDEAIGVPQGNDADPLSSQEAVSMK